MHQRANPERRFLDALHIAMLEASQHCHDPCDGDPFRHFPTKRGRILTLWI